MTTQLDWTQRWTERRESWRPAAEPFDPRRHEVARIGRTEAAGFVVRHHYSGSHVASRFDFALMRDGALAGVCSFSVPMPGVLRVALGAAAPEGIELGRLVLLDQVEGNAESWFVARAFRELRREGVSGVVSFSDPAPRYAPDGLTVIHPGHVGIVYQALGARYLGRATPRTVHLLPDGRIFNGRTEQKARCADPRGGAPARDELIAYGARPPTAAEWSDDARRRAWLAEALAQVTRPMRHPGNHRYAWSLSRSLELLPNPAQYPEPPMGRRPAQWGRRAEVAA